MIKFLLTPFLFVALLTACTPKDSTKTEHAPQAPASAESRPAGAAEAESAAYIREHVTVKDVRVGEGRGGTKGEETLRALYGTVSNGGDRALKKVTIEAELLDADHKAVAAAEFVPVIAEQSGQVEEALLLQGHSDRSFGYSIERMVPEGWNGTARVTVTGVEFHQ